LVTVVGDRIDGIDFLVVGLLSVTVFRLNRFVTLEMPCPEEDLGGSGYEVRMNGSGAFWVTGGGTEFKKSSKLSSARGGFDATMGSENSSSSSSSETSMAYGSRGPRRFRLGIGGASAGPDFERRGARELEVDSAPVLARDGVTLVSLSRAVSINIRSSESMVFLKGATVRGMR
jgi:hypothetical protein